MERTSTCATELLPARTLPGHVARPTRTLAQLVLLVGVLTATACGGGDSPQAIEPGASIAVGADATAVAATKDALWVSVPEGLVRIDPETRQIVARVHATSNRYLPEAAGWLAADDATVWV